VEQPESLELVPDAASVDEILVLFLGRFFSCRFSSSFVLCKLSELVLVFFSKARNDSKLWFGLYDDVLMHVVSFVYHV
jgi:hypothetical protein